MPMHGTTAKSMCKKMHLLCKRGLAVQGSVSMCSNGRALEVVAVDGQLDGPLLGREDVHRLSKPDNAHWLRRPCCQGSYAGHPGHLHTLATCICAHAPLREVACELNLQYYWVTHAAVMTMACWPSIRYTSDSTLTAFALPALPLEGAHTRSGHTLTRGALSGQPVAHRLPRTRTATATGAPGPCCPALWSPALRRQLRTPRQTS